MAEQHTFSLRLDFPSLWTITALRMLRRSLHLSRTHCSSYSQARWARIWASIYILSDPTRSLRFVVMKHYRLEWLTEESPPWGGVGSRHPLSFVTAPMPNIYLCSQHKADGRINCVFVSSLVFFIMEPRFSYCTVEDSPFRNRGGKAGLGVNRAS